MDEYETMTEYILIKVYTRIKRNAILTIVDMRACMSVIIKPLIQTLGLKWVSSFRKNVIFINGKPQPVLREIENLQVVIADVVTYIKTHVVNSVTKLILLRTD